MVKVSDLGYISKNLQDIPSKDKRKEAAYNRAVSNLASSDMPDRLRPVDLPDSLISQLMEGLSNGSD